MSVSLGESDYRRAGVQRLRESWVLLDASALTGSVYLGGRAVESMLRALIWRNDQDIRGGRKSLDTGHDLREMLLRVADLGVLAQSENRDSLARSVQRVGKLWNNNMRFFPDEKLVAYWRALGEVSGRRPLKIAAGDYYRSCLEIVKRCEALCED